MLLFDIWVMNRFSMFNFLAFFVLFLQNLLSKYVLTFVDKLSWFRDYLLGRTMAPFISMPLIFADPWNLIFVPLKFPCIWSLFVPLLFSHTLNFQDFSTRTTQSDKQTLSLPHWHTLTHSDSARCQCKSNFYHYLSPVLLSAEALLHDLIRSLMS